jgi:hypothetical protein
MRNILKHSSILILVLFLGQLVECAIPHTHHEKAGIITADFSGDMDASDHEDETSEKLHSSFYQNNLENISFSSYASIYLLSYVRTQLKPTETSHNENYNILPKVLNSLLFIIHIYASKAPPTF